MIIRRYVPEGEQGRILMSLKVIYFKSIFLIDLLYEKTDLYAGIWNNFTQSAVQQEIEKKAENTVRGA